MRASIFIPPGIFRGGNVECGTFCGGELEPGTFHRQGDLGGRAPQPTCEGPSVPPDPDEMTGAGN